MNTQPTVITDAAIVVVKEPDLFVCMTVCEVERQSKEEMEEVMKDEVEEEEDEGAMDIIVLIMTDVVSTVRITLLDISEE